MSDIIQSSAAPVAVPAAAIRRRAFVGGVAVIAAGLGGAVRFGPDWGAGAPPRTAPSPLLQPAPVPLVAPPRPVLVGAIERAEWQSFRKRFITPEGRVVDTANGNVSHSEGQGWGLMGAQACDDPETFALLLAWTQHNLQRRPYDCLHAWRYRPSDAVPVADLNNATDGDLFIAAALARAAVRWNRPDYAVAAARLATAILGLVRQAGARTVLLPGATGFETPEFYTVNPSYYAFALFPDLAALAPSPLWVALRQDGVALILQGRFGRWALPPDWLRVGRHDGTLAIAPGWPPRFSYDAIRVPLHLAWGGMPAAPALDAFGKYWLARRPAPPGWVDLNSDEVAPYAAPAGIRAVAAVATASSDQARGVAIPSIMLANDYYSAGLVLLARLAAAERRSTT